MIARPRSVPAPHSTRSELLIAAAIWGLGWIPLEHLAGQGLIGMPVVFYTYGLLCAVALPVLIWQRRAWWPQRRQLAVICLCGGWATAGLVGSLSEGDVVRAMASELAVWFPRHAQSMDAALALHLRRVGFDPATGTVQAPQALPGELIHGCGGACSDGEPAQAVAEV